MKVGFLFPGQGTELTPELPRRAIELLAPLGLERPSFRELRKTDIFQPVLTALSLSIHEELAPAPDAIAGHSLGEVAAFSAAGCYSPEDAVRIAALRGRLMAQAAADSPGGRDPAAELRKTEEAFARTMADRDHEAFASFLAEEAVFFGRDGEIRGAAEVAAAWKPFFEGPDAPFSWEPEAVTVLDSGALGLSSGPVFAPDGRQIGTFNSVWRREPDGSWRIVFDRGCPECECPSEEDADG